MKLTIDVPEWAQERSIVILAGMELLAIKRPEQPLQVKVIRCNRCGKCCMDVGDSPLIKADTYGGCPFLEIESPGVYKCGAGFDKPYSCLMDPNKKNVPECCIEMVDV